MEKTRILFVDDEPNVLAGLRRSMRSKRDEWDVNFCESAAEALALMFTWPADVVVSDMRMPHMDGADFLSTVRTRCPGTIRIILSGYADAECVMRTVGPAHLYLAKPCDPEVLGTAIVRPLALRRLMASDGLRQTLMSISSLPSPPDLYLKLEHELHSPRASAASVANIISGDVAMVAELLKLTNSAYFSVSSKVTTVLQAVKTLGIETIENLVLRIGIFRQYDRSSSSAATMRALNEYSLHVARLAEMIAVAEGADPSMANSAHCAGMLAAIGALVLLDNRPAEYRRAIDRVGPTLPLHDAETEAFGAGHTLVGAYLLGLWGFADAIVEAVAYAAQPSACKGRDNLLLAAVHGARALGPGFPILADGVSVPAALDEAYLKECGLHERVEHWRKLAQSVFGAAKESVNG